MQTLTFTIFQSHVTLLQLTKQNHEQNVKRLMRLSLKQHTNTDQRGKKVELINLHARGYLYIHTYMDISNYEIKILFRN